MGFFSDLKPTRMVRDTSDYLRGEQKYKFRFMLAALAATMMIFIAFSFESGFEKEYVRPPIYWVETLDPDRTDAQIADENMLRQIDKDIALQKRADRQAEIQESYKRTAEMFGMDTE